MLAIQSAIRQGATLRLHTGSGADDNELLGAIHEALAFLGQGKEL